MSKALILDVGCGSRPLGTVNVDIYQHPSLQLPRNSVFILASGSHLPFRNKVFETVISDNSLEHCSEYRLFFKELLRVSSDHVLIYTSHIFSNMNRQTELHKQYFNLKWFDRTLTLLGLQRRKNFKVYVSGWNYFPHQFFPLFKTPRQISVEIYKKNWK